MFFVEKMFWAKRRKLVNTYLGSLQMEEADKRILFYALMFMDSEKTARASAECAVQRMAGESAFSRDMVYALIENQNAPKNYESGRLGWQGYKMVKRMVDLYAAEKKNPGIARTDTQNWCDVANDAIKFINKFYIGAAFVSGGNFYCDSLNKIYKAVINDKRKAVVSSLFNKYGAIKADDKTIENICQSTIIGEDVLDDMSYQTRQSLVSYLGEIVNRRTETRTKRWPIQYIDFSGLRRYTVSPYRLKDILDYTMSHSIITEPESEYMWYEIKDGVLALGVRGKKKGGILK